MAKIQAKPIDAVVAVTYLCNSRCIMCNIWQIKDPPKLKAAEYLKLPNTLRDINISGGEPFMRPDLAEVIRNIVTAAPAARIIISTNGFATELILARMKEILKIKPSIGVSVSIDGVGDKHVEVRRIPDGFNKCLRTLEGLRELGVKNLKVGFTAGDYNIDHLSKMYDLTRKLGVEFTMAAVHNSENYFRITTNKIDAFNAFERQFRYVIDAELSTLNPKRWARAYFTHGLLQIVKTGKRILPDYGGRLSFYLDPDGSVYPADVSTRRLGNLQAFKTFQELLVSPKSQEVMEGKDPAHWMVCTARTAMKKHWMKVGFWILKSKLQMTLHSGNKKSESEEARKQISVNFLSPTS